MVHLLSRLLLGTFALLLTAYLVAGISIDGLYTAIITAIILGILNAVVRPILFILTLPITIITLGLFHFVINAGLFMFAASFIDGFSVSSFWYALLGSLLVSIINTVGSRFLR
ncbi:MAG TPA: phage holin family protein [Candidatus Paceibacterota bacterium]|nr:phage holin family protein [Candidatus Paceibacterota bacterium]